MDEKSKQSFLTPKRIVILVVVAVAGALLARVAFRFALDLMLGGTMWGGNFL